MIRVPALSLGVLLLLLLAAASPAEEAPWVGLRPLGTDELVVYVRLLTAQGDGLATVPLDHRFVPGESFVFDVSPSRGGYVALHALDAKRRLRQRIWPPEPGGFPVAAQDFVRLPPVHSLSVSGAGPTRLALLFLPTPLAPATAPASPGRWLKQVRLRDVVLNPAPLPDVPASIFQGRLSAGEPVGLEIDLKPAEGRK